MAPPDRYQVKDEEKRRRVESELLADPTRSTRAIAKAAAVSQSTVFRLRRELENGGDARLLATKKEAPKIVNGPKADRQRQQMARNELIKDPKRSNRSIAALIGLSPDTIRHMRNRMEAAKEISVVSRDERVNAAGEIGTYSGAGGKINVPDDIPLMQLASKGLLAEEENGMAIEDVSLLLGIAPETYRNLRIVRLLSLRDDLSKADAKLVKETIEKVESARQIGPFWPDIEPLAAKVWGKRISGGPKAEAKRRSAFDHALGLITDMCNRGPEVEIPYLSEEEQVAALHKVAEAIGNLRQLNVNIRKARG